jgi:hypothetical protein
MAAIRLPKRAENKNTNDFSSPLKNAVVAFFNLAKCGAKLRTKAQNNDLRRHFGIASMRWRRGAEYFDGLLGCDWRRVRSVDPAPQL